MATEKALRYEGGGSLSFRDGAGARRHVLHGASFLVDAKTAEILLRDPAVVPGDGDEVPRGNSAPQVPRDQGRAPEADQTPPQIELATAKKDDLLAYAKLLGLTMAKRTPAAEVRASIEAELKRRQAGSMPLADPTSTAIATGQPVPFADVKARAIALGLKAVGVKRVDLEGAITAEEVRLAAEAAALGDQGGDGTPADDPDATATGEAGQPPSGPGAITLGDLPAGGVRHG